MKSFDAAFFERHKLTPEDLKSHFNKVSNLSDTEIDQKAASNISMGVSKPEADKPLRHKYASEGVARIAERIFSRMRDGINRNINEGNIYWAVDKAYDVAFSQVATTLVEGLLDESPDSPKVLQAVKDWGLTHLLTNVPCSCSSTPCSCGCKDKKVLNLPVFFRVFVPLVKAYVNIRWAKIYTDRNVFPLLKYEPLKSTAINRLRTEIITDRVQLMSTQFGYNSVLRQEILYALLYSKCFTFPKEHWYRDEVEGELQREGLRYNIPHPSRVYVDPADRPSTFNTDSGCSWAFYWNIVPWRYIAYSDSYFNKDLVSYGKDWITTHPSYFEEIYPCTLRFPDCGSSGSITPGIDEHLRDEKLNSYYTNSDDDKAVVEGQYFEKLNPSHYGISEYDGEVWFRFVTASYDTILYVEALSYPPVRYTGYDADENRDKNASLALEIMPFQDQIGNMLSQYILSVKQNLMKMVFYNKEMVDGDQITKIENMGEKKFRTIPFIAYSGREVGFAQTGPEKAFFPVSFPVQNTQELAACINTVLNILERLLSMSAQELGQPATHEQTANEVAVISANVGTRLALTASFVDDAIHSWKTQIYKALMANGAEEMYAYIEYERSLDEKLLKAIGFSVIEDGVEGSEETLKEIASGDDFNYHVKGNKKGLIMEGFVSNREGENRVNGPQIAAAMAQLLASLANPTIAELFGKEQVVRVFNQIATIAGLPRDFRLKDIPGTGQVGTEQIVQSMQALQQDVAKAIHESQQATIQEVAQAITPIQEAIKNVSASDAQQNDTIQQVIQKMNDLAALVQPINPIPNDSVPPVPVGS